MDYMSYGQGTIEGGHRAAFGSLVPNMIPNRNQCPLRIWQISTAVHMFWGDPLTI